MVDCFEAEIADAAHHQVGKDDDDEGEAHAPSDFVAYLHGEHERLRLRDLNELQDLWREEELRRKRERARFYYRERKPARGGE